MTFEKSLRRKPAKIREQAIALADRVRAGETAVDLDARRMRYSRNRLSISIGRAWRLVLREVDGTLEPVALMSHEDYSRSAKAGSR